MSGASATLIDAIEAAAQSLLNGMHTCLPGRVESYDHTTRKAAVKPLIKRPDLDSEAKPLPVIPAVPVIFPWAGQASLTFPISKGDTGAIFFSERSLDTWLAKGGDVAPVSSRKFHLTDAIFIPGLAPFSVTGPAEDAASLLLKFGIMKIRMNGGKIAIGNAQAELLDILDQFLARIQTATVPTAVGTYPIVYGGAPIAAEITTLRALLNLIKGTL
jgi:hypothetical protein